MQLFTFDIYTFGFCFGDTCKLSIPNSLMTLMTLDTRDT